MNNAFYIVVRCYTSTTSYNIVVGKIYESSLGDVMAGYFSRATGIGGSMTVSERGAYGYRLYILTKKD